MGVSAKTAIKQAVNNGRYKKEAWQYREFGSAHGIVFGWGFFWGGGWGGGWGRSLAFIAR